MKNLLSVLLAAMLLVTTACAAASETQIDSSAQAEVLSNPGQAPFSDVPADAWYAEAVEYVRGIGVMSGTSATTFSPGLTMTRAMLATVLYRAAGSPAVTGSPGFADVPDGAWYADATRWAAENGIISGYGNGRFGSGDPVSREQIATMLWRYDGGEDVDFSAGFTDAAAIAAYAAEAVDWAAAKGVVAGMADGSFAPKASATRAQVAVMLHRYLTGGKTEPSGTPESPGSSGRTLIAYFSATGTTEGVAGHIAAITGGDLHEILAADPYTAEDLDYYSGGRADQEQSDPAARPAIDGSVEDMDGYDVIFLGYPIWHGQAPRIISTFLESCDLASKTIVPFCTSHSSGIGSSDGDLYPLAPEARWLEGRRFAAGAARETIEAWIGGLDLPVQRANVNPGGFNFETRSVTLNSGYEMPINGLGTYSLHGDTCVDSVTAALNSGVRLIDTAHIYGNEEEIGRAIRDSGVPREEIFVITKLYPNQFSRAAEAIDLALETLDIGYIDMMLLHHPGTGDVEAYKAMERAVEDGKLRSIGLSNWYVAELEAFLPQVSITPALVQNEIHPYYQENDVIPYMQEKGIVVQGWYPLGGRGHTAELLGDPVISEIAAAHAVSSAQVILRWNLQKGVVVIPGSSNPEHIRENTELYHFALTDDEMACINALDRNEKHDWY